MHMLMRLFLLLATVLSGMAAAESPAAKDLHAVNTVCPVDGRKIDPKLAPERVEVEGEHEVGVGICSEDCRRKIAADPKVYGKAAIANKKAEPAK